MKRSLLLLIPALALVTLPCTAQQQDIEWYAVFAEHVPSSNLLAYEEAGQDLVSIFGESEITDVSWATVSSFDLGYSYVFAGTGPADLAELYARLGAAMEAIGERGAAAMKKSDGLVESRDIFFLTLRPDLSYLSEAGGFSADSPFRINLHLFVQPAMVEEFETAVQEWVEAYAELGIEHGWRTYQYATGNDLPAYLMVETAVDHLDYYTWTAEVEKTLGDRGWELWEKAMPAIRRMDQSYGWYREDLSYAAPEEGS